MNAWLGETPISGWDRPRNAERPQCHTSSVRTGTLSEPKGTLLPSAAGPLTLLGDFIGVLSTVAAAALLGEGATPAGNASAVSAWQTCPVRCRATCKTAPENTTAGIGFRHRAHLTGALITPKLLLLSCTAGHPV